MKIILKVVCASVLLAMMSFTGTVSFKNITTNPKTIINAENDYDGEFVFEGRRYQYRNKGASEIGLVRVLDDAGEIIIPPMVNIDDVTYTVTTLEDWFGAGQSFTKVYVPNTVRTIADQVFYGAKIDDLQISNNVETIGGYFCSGAKVKSVSCDSKSIASIEGGGFYNAECPEIIIFGEWLVKLKAKSGSKTIDMTSSELLKVKKACICAIEIDESVTDLKLSSKIDNYNVYLNEHGFTRICNIYIKNVYVDGEKVTCKSADDTCPDTVKDNYSAFEGTPFSLDYSYDKAKYLLNSMGITYYGKECEKVKGTLSGGEEYNIAFELHNYIVNNYVYDIDEDSSFDSVFNCHRNSKCQFDAEMYAFLLECAGVEAETVASEELIPLSSSEKKKYVEENPDKPHPKANYKYGYRGDHAWNAVKIGGKWYYIDTTGDRKNDFFAMFMFSNETIEKGKLFWSRKYIDEDGNERRVNDYGHAYPHFISYEYYTCEDWVNEWFMAAHPFQNKKTMLNVPNCNEVNGDIDGDYYCYNRYNEEEVNKYKAFLLQDEYLKRRIVNSTDGYIYASKEEIKKLNGVGGGYYVFHLVEEEEGNNKVKLLINYKVLDINCDGEYRTNDLVALMQRSLGKPSEYK